ncbi:MAG: carboxypeptidase [Candidatus Accumulibacter sp.]|uniref:Carboxypeptidase n=1 Tax=Candidatus Accumulibacter affinis TaxID=2954384 RepID=A0A935W8E3_9PROT|nr:carboxypeptidase [Candidatus Accumulibacter affinis]
MKLTKLTSIPAGASIPIKDLGQEKLTELQVSLTRLGYPIGKIDGLYGPNSRNAWAEFVADFQLGEPQSIDADDVKKLQQAMDKSTSSSAHRFSSKEGTIDAIKAECEAQGLGLKTQIAYVLATADHETNHTLKPVKEAYWLKDPDAYLKAHHADYYPYYGRGFVQLTWKDNYAKYGKLLGRDLVGHPDLALEPDVALFVLVHGFKIGTFTGRKLSDYVNKDATDFVNARRCINGLDRANDIASIARNYAAKL